MGTIELNIPNEIVTGNGSIELQMNVGSMADGFRVQESPILHGTTPTQEKHGCHVNRDIDSNRNQTDSRKIKWIFRNF